MVIRVLLFLKNVRKAFFADIITIIVEIAIKIMINNEKKRKKGKMNFFNKKKIFVCGILIEYQEYNEIC